MCFFIFFEFLRLVEIQPYVKVIECSLTCKILCAWGWWSAAALQTIGLCSVARQVCYVLRHAAPTQPVLAQCLRQWIANTDFARQIRQSCPKKWILQDPRVVQVQWVQLDATGAIARCKNALQLWRCPNISWGFGTASAKGYSIPCMPTTPEEVEIWKNIDIIMINLSMIDWSWPIFLPCFWN